jgi:hypothetical protein
MENYTKEFYLENRKKTKFEKQIFYFGVREDYNHQIDDLITTLNECKEEFKDKEDVYLSIDDSSYDDYGEFYLMVSWKDWETEEDFNIRMYNEKWAKERAVESLKRLIERNPQEAVEIIKELKLV